MSITDFRGLAELIASKIKKKNPIISGRIIGFVGPSNGTLMVRVFARGESVTAMYLPPINPVMNGSVFITRTSGNANADWFVYATNFQHSVPAEVTDNTIEYDTYGTGEYGTGDYGR